MEYLAITLSVFGEGGEASGVSSADAGQVAEGQVAAARDMDAEFDGLIKGEYKAQYDRRVADTIQKRLKSTKDTVDRYNKAQPLFEMMAKKYGIEDANDIDALARAVDEDQTLLEEEAMERGVSTEQMREIRKIERENKELREEMNKRQTEEMARKQYAEWYKQSEDAKRYYNNFNLEEELQREDFRGLLRAGVDVKTAFEVLHKDEIIPAAMQYTATKTAERVAASVRANGARPIENGTSAQGATQSKLDPSKALTKERREALIARAMRGERVTPDDFF